MDCPVCHGNGELEYAIGNEQQSQQQKERNTNIVDDRSSWPRSCPACGGTGYLEQE